MSTDASRARAETLAATKTKRDAWEQVGYDMNGASKQVGDSAGPLPADAQLCHGSPLRPDVIQDFYTSFAIAVRCGSRRLQIAEFDCIFLVQERERRGVRLPGRNLHAAPTLGRLRSSNESHGSPFGYLTAAVSSPSMLHSGCNVSSAGSPNAGYSITMRKCP